MTLPFFPKYLPRICTHIIHSFSHIPLILSSLFVIFAFFFYCTLFFNNIDHTLSPIIDVFGVDPLHIFVSVDYNRHQFVRPFELGDFL